MSDLSNMSKLKTPSPHRSCIWKIIMWRHCVVVCSCLVNNVELQIIYVWCYAFTATNINKIILGYHPCHFVKNSYYPDDGDRDGPRNGVFNELTQEDFIRLDNLFSTENTFQYYDANISHLLYYLYCSSLICKVIAKSQW